MSYYPIPKIINGAFNELDYFTTPAEIARETGTVIGEGDGDLDITNFVQKSGDSMIGFLTLNSGCKFADLSLQQTALTQNMVNTLSNFSLTHGNKLIVSELNFANDSGVVKQTNAFTSTHKSRCDMVPGIQDATAANAVAIVAVDQRVANAETATTQNSLDIIEVDQRVTDATTATALEIVAVDQRVANAETATTQNTLDIIEVDQRITDATTANAVAIVALDQRVANAETATTQNALDIIEVDQRITDATTANAVAIVAVDQRVANAETEIAAVSQRTTDTETATSTNAAAIVAVSQRTTDTETATSTNAVAITEMGNRVTSTETDIVAMDQHITNIETSTTQNALDITEVGNRVTSTETEIVAMDQHITNIETSTTQNTLNINELFDRVSETETDIVAVDQRVTDVETDIANLEQMSSTFVTTANDVTVTKRMYFNGTGAYIQNVNNSMYLYSIQSDMVLHSGNFPIIAWTTKLQIGNASAGCISMAGEIQNVCFTDARNAALTAATAGLAATNTTANIVHADLYTKYNQHVYAIQQIVDTRANRLLLHFKRDDDWSLMNRTTMFANGAGYNYTPIYNIFQFAEFSPYVSVNREWNMGPRRVSFKFLINFASKGSALSTCKSRWRMTHAASPNVFTSDHMYVGLDHKANYDFDQNVMYQDTITFDIINGDRLFIESNIYMAMEFNRSFQYAFSIDMVEI